MLDLHDSRYNTSCCDDMKKSFSQAIRNAAAFTARLDVTYCVFIYIRLDNIKFIT